MAALRTIILNTDTYTENVIHLNEQVLLATYNSRLNDTVRR